MFNEIIPGYIIEVRREWLELAPYKDERSNQALADHVASVVEFKAWKAEHPRDGTMMTMYRWAPVITFVASVATFNLIGIGMSLLEYRKLLRSVRHEVRERREMSSIDGDIESVRQAIDSEMRKQGIGTLDKAYGESVARAAIIATIEALREPTTHQFVYLTLVNSGEWRAMLNCKRDEFRGSTGEML